MDINLLVTSENFRGHSWAFGAHKIEQTTSKPPSQSHRVSMANNKQDF